MSTVFEGGNLFSYIYVSKNGKQTLIKSPGCYGQMRLTGSIKGLILPFILRPDVEEEDGKMLFELYRDSPAGRLLQTKTWEEGQKNGFYFNVRGMSTREVFPYILMWRYMFEWGNALRMVKYFGKHVTPTIWLFSLFIFNSKPFSLPQSLHGPSLSFEYGDHNFQTFFKPVDRRSIFKGLEKKQRYIQVDDPLIGKFKIVTPPLPEDTVALLKEYT